MSKVTLTLKRAATSSYFYHEYEDSCVFYCISGVERVVGPIPYGATELELTVSNRPFKGSVKKRLLSSLTNRVVHPGGWKLYNFGVGGPLFFLTTTQRKLLRIGNAPGTNRYLSARVIA